MPKFCVTVLRNFNEKAEVMIEADNKTAAEEAAEELVVDANSENDEYSAIEWHYVDMVNVQVIDVREAKPAA